LYTADYHQAYQKNVEFGGTFGICANEFWRPVSEVDIGGT